MLGIRGAVGNGIGRCVLCGLDLRRAPPGMRRNYHSQQGPACQLLSSASGAVVRRCSACTTLRIRPWAETTRVGRARFSGVDSSQTSRTCDRDESESHFFRFALCRRLQSPIDELVSEVRVDGTECRLGVPSGNFETADLQFHSRRVSGATARPFRSSTGSTLLCVVQASYAQMLFPLAPVMLSWLVCPRWAYRLKRGIGSISTRSL